MFNSIYTPGNHPVFTLAADTATGKTFSTSHHVIRNGKLRNQVIVCKKSKLLKQWKKDLIAHGANPARVTIIDTLNKKAGESVIPQVHQWFEDHKGCENITGHILLITQAALNSIPRVEGKAEIDIYFDELPKAHEGHGVKVHSNPELIKSRLMLGPRVATCKTFVTGEDGKREEVEDSVHLVTALHKDGLQDELKNYGQNFNKAESGLFTSVCSGFEDVFIKRTMWDNIGKRKKKREDNEKGVTLFVSLVNKNLFTGWHSVTIISADFDRSILKEWLSKPIHEKQIYPDSILPGKTKNEFPLKFIHHKPLGSKLRNGGKHPLSWIKRSQFVYFLDPEEKEFNSKAYLEKVNDKGETNTAIIDKKFYRELQKMGNPDFIMTTNDKLSTDGDRTTNRAPVTVGEDGNELSLFDLPNHTPVSSMDSGSNAYMDKHVLFFDAALNLSPAYEGVLVALGISKEIIFEDMVINSLYQIASRLSLRDNESQEQVTIFCAEGSSAMALARRFAAHHPGQEVRIRHIDEPEFQSVPVSCEEVVSCEENSSFASGLAPTDIDENHSYCIKSLHLDNYSAGNRCKTSNHGGSSDFSNFKNESFQPPLSAKGAHLDGVAELKGVTMVPYERSGKWELEDLDLCGWVNKLEDASEQEVLFYEAECDQYTPAIFQEGKHGRKPTAKRRGKKRTTDLFSHSWFVTLDFDGNDQPYHEGSITPEGFEKIFNSKRANRAKGHHKLSYVIHSTYNRCADNPYKFRVIVFLKRPATSQAEYQAVIHHVQDVLAQNGYPESGLDPNSMKPGQLFRMPCKNPNEHHYFKKRNVKNARNVQRNGLDPVELLKQYPPAPTAAPKPTIDKPKAKTGFNLESVKGQYRALTDGRRLGLKQAGKRMATTGAMGPGDVEIQLLSLIDTGDPDMLKRVKDTITQLEKEVRWWGMAA